MSQVQWFVKSAGKKVEKENKGMKIVVPAFDNSSLIASYTRTLIGRCLNPQRQDMKLLLARLPKIWQVDDRVVGADLGMGKFQFDFEREDDIKAVLSEEPFHFDSWMLSIVRWEPVMDANYPSNIKFWVKIFGVPLHFWAEQTFRSIGDALGTVVGDVDVYDGRVRVEMDSFKPLVFSSSIEFHSGEETVIDIRYEKLHGFCRLCNNMRHDQGRCPTVIPQGEERKHDLVVDRDGKGDKSLSYRGALIKDRMNREDRVERSEVDGVESRGKQADTERKFNNQGADRYKDTSKHSVRDRFTRPYGEGSSRNGRSVGHHQKNRYPDRVARPNRGISESASELGKHLEDPQKIMLDAFLGGPKVVTKDSGGRIEASTKNSDSKAKKVLLFEEENEGLTAPEELGSGVGRSRDLSLQVSNQTVGVEIPDFSGIEAQMEEDDRMEEKGDGSEPEGKGNLEENQFEMFEEGEVNLGMLDEEVPKAVDSQILEEQNQEETKEDQLKKRRLARPGGLIIGGSTKKRLVQGLISPRKKAGMKQGIKGGEKGTLPPKKSAPKELGVQEQ